ARSLLLTPDNGMTKRSSLLFRGGRMVALGRSRRTSVASRESDMPYHDFRQFLDTLRQQGELIDVNRPIALTDVGKAMKQSYRRQGPGLVFNRNGTEFPLVCGVYSTRSKALLAFEADDKTILQKVLAGLDNPIAPVTRNG